MSRVSILFVVALTLLSSLMSCTLADPEGPAFDVDSTMTGTDQDMHGCMASAGFLWCEATNECERVNELAKAQGFENNAEAFARFCAITEVE